MPLKQSAARGLSQDQAAGALTRWVDADGNIYERDGRHGTVEKYDPRGKHLGEFDPETGNQRNPGIPNRSVEP